MATSNVYKLDYQSFPTTQGGLFSPVKMYIYNTDELDLYHTIVDVTGSAVPNSIMFDGEKNIFDWIKKTSLELSIVREDESWFTDLIDGYDDQWAICVVQDGNMRHKELGVWTGTGGEFSGTLLFYGKLTFQTYSEAYAYKAEIRLTFHDRIGVMEDELFEQSGNVVSLLDIMANCLRPCVCSNNLVAEFPYTSVEYPDATGLEYLALPGSKYAGEKKIDVVESICKSFGLRVDTDFTYKRTDTMYQSPEICGAVWLRHIASQKNETINNRQYIASSRIVGGATYDAYSFLKSGYISKTAVSTSSSITIVNFNANLPEFIPGSTAEDDRLYYVLVQMAEGATNYYDPRNNTALIYLTTNESKLVAGQPYIRANSADVKVSQIRDYWNAQFPSNGLTFDVSGNTITTTQTKRLPGILVINYNHSSLIGTWTNQYIYSEDNVPASIKDIDQTNITLINNSASFELDIKAKSIEIDWKPKNIGNLFQGGNPENFDFVNREQDGNIYNMHRYTTVITDNDTPINLKRYLSGVAVTENLRLGARKANYGGDTAIQLTVRSEVLFGNPNVQRYVQGPLPAVAIENQFLSASFSVVAKNAREFDADGEPRSASVYVSWFAVTEAGAIYYYKNKDEGWLLFDQFTIQFWNSGNAFRNQVTKVWNSLSVDSADMVRHPYAEIGTNTPYKLYFAISGDYTEVNLPEVMFIKDCKFSVTGVQFPTEIKQTTNIAPKNRKSIKVDIDVNTFPGGTNDTLFYTDCLVNWPSGTACRLLTYEGLNQTLQAHLGDQYALEYQFDRWMFSVELLGQIKLRDILRLQPEGRLFVVAEGGFDIKARQFKGTLAEFVTTEAKDALLSEDGTYILQEDNSKILI